MVARLPALAEIAAKVPMEKLSWPVLDSLSIECWIRRDDLLPAWCQGNKFYKLYYNICSAPKAARWVSFGGAFSNHLYALALAGKELGHKTVGIVRGERPAHLSPTLCDAEAAGMELIFMSREKYRALTAHNGFTSDWSQIKSEVAHYLGRDDDWIVPEGGANRAGLDGCKHLGLDIGQRGRFTDVLLAVGTGTTLAGVAQGLASADRPSISHAAERYPTGYVPQVTGVSVLGALRSSRSTLKEEINLMLNAQDTVNWRLLEGVSPGAYGRSTPELEAFMVEFKRDTGVQLDQVYTAKLFWVIQQQAKAGLWPAGSKLLAIHTGGLQGLRGLHFKTARK